MQGRLEQLEKDISFLSAMQGLILPPNGDQNALQRELNLLLNQRRTNPNVVVDPNTNSIKTKDKILTRKNYVLPHPRRSEHLRNYVDKNSKNRNSNKNCQQPPLNDGVMCGCVSHRRERGASAKSRSRTDANSHSTLTLATASEEFLDTVPEEAGGDSQLQFQGLDREKLDALKYELHFEKGKRVELQEASMRVAVKLQKVWLKLKLLQLTHDAEMRSAAVKHKNSELSKNLAQVQSKLEVVQSQQSVTLTENQATKEENQKLQFQVDQLLEQSVRLEKEKEGLMKELAESSTKAKEMESQFRQVNEQLNKLQHQFQEHQLQHSSILQKSQSNLAQQRRIVTTQIEQCYSLLAKTKPLISQLQLEKESLEKSLAQQQAENICFLQQLKLANAKLRSLEEYEKRSQEQLGNVVSKNMDRITRLQSESSELKCKLKEEREERDNMLELISAAKHKLVSERSKFAEGQEKDKLEKERLHLEVARIQDNFNVLQKINQDNTNTISKLRTEGDEQKRQKSELEHQLTEKTGNEQKLSMKLRDKEAQCMELEDQLDYLQEQVRAMRGEIEEHDCEDHVESVYKSRLAKVESLLGTQTSELQSKLETLKSERDQAVAAGRRCVQIVQHTKLECENRILQLRTSTKQEVVELEEKRQAEMAYYKKKIADLELELKHAWSNTHETQQRLSNKIQHLQAVLTTTAQALCHGGGDESNCNVTTLGVLNNANAMPEDIAGIDESIKRKFNEYFSRAAVPARNPFL